MINTSKEAEETQAEAVRIGVIGLGYVGLPACIAFAHKFETTGFDVNTGRIEALHRGEDVTGEVAADEITEAHPHFTADPEDLRRCNFFVVAVPTPVNRDNSPDFSMLRRACQTLGPVMPKGSIVVFESTVYPGATEEICGPELEAASGLVCGRDFKLGYSPERINPGDKAHPLHSIVKVVSGQDAQSLERIADVYGAIITAGIHRASSIKVAEAAKVLENTQRDINIALMNEVSKICDLVGIRTCEVLEAAGTKWNFLNFTPGLVGGHCIGVDPYYLTSKATQLGYHPEVILAGRRINDNMARHVASRILRMLAGRDSPITQARVGILGVTFKENVPDIRNSKVFDLCRELRHFGIEPLLADPLADREATQRSYGFALSDPEDWSDLDLLVLAVPHRIHLDAIQRRLARTLRKDGFFVDLKSAIDPSVLPEGIGYWSL